MQEAGGALNRTDDKIMRGASFGSRLVGQDGALSQAMTLAANFNLGRVSCNEEISRLCRRAPSWALTTKLWRSPTIGSIG